MNVGRSALSGAKHRKKRRFFIMKRFFTIFLASLLVLSLAACGGEGSKVDAAWKDIFGAADNQIVLK
jgi:hypothetical protein